MQSRNQFEAARKAEDLEQRAQFCEGLSKKARGPAAGQFRQKARDLRREASEVWHGRPGYQARPLPGAMAVLRGRTLSAAEMRQYLGTGYRAQMVG